MADSGYQGVHDINREMIIPHKKPRGGELSMEEKMNNKKLSQDRIIVENFFERMKIIFGISYVV